MGGRAPMILTVRTAGGVVGTARILTLTMGSSGHTSPIETPWMVFDHARLTYRDPAREANAERMTGSCVTHTMGGSCRRPRQHDHANLAAAFLRYCRTHPNHGFRQRARDEPDVNALRVLHRDSAVISDQLKTQLGMTRQTPATRSTSDGRTLSGWREAIALGKGLCPARPVYIATIITLIAQVLQLRNKITTFRPTRKKGSAWESRNP